ncbi:hypothetical protein AB0E25_30605 [Streptomyces bobili]
MFGTGRVLSGRALAGVKPTGAMWSRVLAVLVGGRREFFGPPFGCPAA